MLKRDVQYVVKVLSGANQGATAELRDRSGVVIGGSLGCDIVFSSVNVADRHVSIEVEGTKIRLTPLAQPVYIDGKDVGSHEILLRPNQLVNIGTVSFTVADQAQSWPAIDPVSKEIIAERGVPFENRGINRSTEVVNQKPTNFSIFNNPWLWVAMVFMVLVNVHYASQSYGGIPGLLGIKKTVGGEIENLIDAEKFPSLYVTQMENGDTKISGYVATSKQENLLKRQIEGFEEKVVLQIFVDTDLENRARSISRSLGENDITFSTLEHGRLKASGLAESRNGWLTIKGSIRSDVDGVTSINDDDVRNLLEMFLVLQKQVDKEVFAERIVLGLKKRIITVEGKLTKEEKNRWVQVKEEFMKDGEHPFRFIELLRAPDADIKLSIRSVSIGEVPFVVSKEGNKYFNGSHVGSGYYIDSINDDHILLRNNNIAFPVYFGQDKE